MGLYHNGPRLRIDMIKNDEEEEENDRRKTVFLEKIRIAMRIDEKKTRKIKTRTSTMIAILIEYLQMNVSSWKIRIYEMILTCSCHVQQSILNLTE